MHFTSFFVSALATTAIASPIVHVKRDAASILSSISAISAQITTLNNTLNTFTPGNLINTFTILKIQQQTKQIEDAITAATNTAGNSKNLNADDSGKIATAVLDFTPKTYSLLDNLQSKKPVFDKAILGLISVSSMVKDSLQRQKQLSASFSSTLASKLAEPFKSLAPFISAPLADAFDMAIKTFSAPSGGLLG
ncbi:antigenic cell wall galactomannoprotein [Zymoseptoria brevis]|uniref:Antigenic cell wall galactomannoprotein n=1 Tax=Zymoseptoria brevis TaxID=1047168 RepID=A0A0F4GXN6_9PEZI|nr:antigenic cell wall galactomannoprotein [Zymoseptoria brevis]